MALKLALRFAAISVIAITALLYLRDPPWLLGYSHGFHSWETTDDGRRFRWTAGRASFHVPADSRAVTIPLRSPDTAAAWPVTATLTIDDLTAARITLDDESWRTVTVPLPPEGGRRSRRIDIKLNRLGSGNRGIQVGVVEFIR